MWSQNPKVVRRTPMRTIVKEKPGPKGNGCQADTPLKSFELFFDDAIIREIVTWSNQEIENVKTSYTSKSGFLYKTSVREIRALISILLFLIIPHARQRLEVQQRPQDVKQVIRCCGILPEAPSPAPSTTHRHSAQRKRCYICPRSKDKESKFICNECNNFVCEDNSKWLCNQCQEKKLDLQIMILHVK